MNLRTAFAPRPVASSLPRHLGRAAARSLVFCLLMAAPVVGFYSTADRVFGVGDLGYEIAAPEHGAAAGPSPVEVLVERHGCWSGEAPDDMVGVLPGRVVVSEPGEGPRVAGERMVGLALEQIFEGADHGLTVHAFCR
jgi:hypothetical protein